MLRSPCFLFALAFTATAPAQAIAPQLLLDLGHEERSVDAVRKLVAAEAPAVAALQAALRDPQFRSERRRLTAAIYALGKLGPVAAPAARQLIDEIDRADGDDVLRNLYWALGELGPAADQGRGEVLRAVTERRPRPGMTHQEWAFACKRIEFGTHPTTGDLAFALDATEQAGLVAAAGALCRLPVGAPVPRQQLLAAWTRTEAGWRRNGSSWSRAALELARAVVRHASDAPEAGPARASLIYHFDVEVRLEAVMQLGQVGAAGAAAAVKALGTSLAEDGSILVRREAATALGLLGKAAAPAVPQLQALLQDADAQLRARAAAALRAIAPPK